MKKTTKPKAKTATKTDTAKAAPKPADNAEQKMSRCEAVGRVLAKRGLDAKIDAAMIGEIDQLYGQANPRETLFAARNARNAIRGYLLAAKK